MLTCVGLFVHAVEQIKVRRFVQRETCFLSERQPKDMPQKQVLFCVYTALFMNTLYQTKTKAHTVVGRSERCLRGDPGSELRLGREKEKETRDNNTRDEQKKKKVPLQNYIQ